MITDLAVEALKRDLVKMLAEVLRAENSIEAASILRLVSNQIDFALDEMEASS